MPKIKILAKGADVLVREYTLEPGEEGGAWHRHSEVNDIVYCLEGTLVCEILDPENSRGTKLLQITAGNSGEVPVSTVHRLSNQSGKTCRYLLIQGVGKYDFLKAEK